MGLYSKLALIQGELKAPKNQFNSFGKYKYRSCEDILEAAKPICIKHGAVLTVSDKVVFIGERYYIEASAILTDTEDDKQVINTASARESETKKGMDDSQITGTASSYARKYALNGLFCIDDTKDADTDEHKNQTNTTVTKITADTTKVTLPMLQDIIKKCGKTEAEYIEWYNEKENTKNISELKYMPQETKQHLFSVLSKKVK